jgi:hypothetical protein
VHGGAVHVWVQAEPVQLGRLDRIGDVLGHPDDQHAPPGLLDRVVAVRLERHHRAPGGGGQLRARHAADDHVGAVQREVDRQDRGQRLIGDRDPSNRDTGEQGQALPPVQRLQRDHGVLDHLASLRRAGAAV